MIGISTKTLNTITKAIVHKSAKEFIDGNVFLEELEKSGYPEEGTSTTYQKAKSYVSCAIGKMG